MTPLAWALALTVGVVVLAHCAVVVAIGRQRQPRTGD